MIEKIKALCVKYREFLVYFIVGCLTTLVAAALRLQLPVFRRDAAPDLRAEHCPCNSRLGRGRCLCLSNEPQMGLSEQEPEHPRRGGRLCRFASRNAWDGLGGHAAARHGARHKRIRDMVHKVRARVPRQLYPQQAFCFQEEKRRIKSKNEKGFPRTGETFFILRALDPTTL